MGKRSPRPMIGTSSPLRREFPARFTTILVSAASHARSGISVKAAAAPHQQEQKNIACCGAQETIWQGRIWRLIVGRPCESLAPLFLGIDAGGLAIRTPRKRRRRRCRQPRWCIPLAASRSWANRHVRLTRNAGFAPKASWSVPNDHAACAFPSMTLFLAAIVVLRHPLPAVS
jgi:hypothetical protein